MRKKKKRKWHHLDWGIYEDVGKKGKRLRADTVCVVGFLVWAAFIYGIYLMTRDDGPADTSHDVTIEKIEFFEPVATVADENFSIRVEGEVNEPLTVELANQYIDSPLVTLNNMIGRAKGIATFGVYLYVIRETPEKFEIFKFNVRWVKSGIHENFKLKDKDLVYIGHRESALNVKSNFELLSNEIQSQIKDSGKQIRWHDLRHK